MAIFNSYVKVPEGITHLLRWATKYPPDPPVSNMAGGLPLFGWEVFLDFPASHVWLPEENSMFYEICIGIVYITLYYLCVWMFNGNIWECYMTLLWLHLISWWHMVTWRCCNVYFCVFVLGTLNHFTLKFMGTLQDVA